MFSHYFIAKLSSLFLVMLFLLGQYPIQVAALSADQKRVFDSGIYYFNTEGDETGCDADGFLVGSKNEERIFNFFLLNKGLSPPQAAGAYGNIMLESRRGNPQQIQADGSSRNPLDAGSLGWGIIQWTPGSKIIDIAKEQGVTGPIYKLATQLEIVWNHMKGTSPTGVSNMLEGYKKINDYKEATSYFEDTIEGAGVVSLEDRQKLAFEGLTKYGSGGSLTSVSDSTLCGGSGEVVGNYSLPVAKKWYNQNKHWFTKPHHDYPAVDIPVSINTPVYSISDGKVIQAPNGSIGKEGGFGLGVTIDAGNGVIFMYGHGIDGGAVQGAKQGDTVKAGQLIMHSGNTGTSSGAHLHVGIQVDGVDRCPQNLFVGIAEGSIPDVKSLPTSGCTN